MDVQNLASGPGAGIILLAFFIGGVCGYALRLWVNRNRAKVQSVEDRLAGLDAQGVKDLIAKAQGVILRE